MSFIQEFLRIDNENIINALENLLRSSKSDIFEANLKPMTLEQLNSEIDSALEDEKSNKITKAKDLKQKIQKWS